VVHRDRGHAAAGVWQTPSTLQTQTGHGSTQAITNLEKNFGLVSGDASNDLDLSDTLESSGKLLRSMYHSGFQGAGQPYRCAVQIGGTRKLEAVCRQHTTADSRTVAQKAACHMHFVSELVQYQHAAASVQGRSACLAAAETLSAAAMAAHTTYCTIGPIGDLHTALCKPRQQRCYRQTA
jgi:hypothetical protein